jgi:hypothetical protein
MSDHVDGPRSIGDPPADITDLFAFTSPKDPARTVLAMCVFPSAGESAVFSNVIDYAIAVRRVSVTGIGNCREVSACRREFRFTFRFEVLDRDAAGNVDPARRLHLPDGRELPVTVNNEKGRRHRRAMSACSPGCAPTRSISPGSPRRSRRSPICFSTTTCSAWSSSSIHAACSIRERLVVRRDRRDRPTEPPGRIGHPVARIDWIGRPEQTNVRLNNPALFGVDDIRDLWNQQTPFAISKELQPLFLQRLKDSFTDWDMRDGKADWTPEALAANANVFLDDFLLFDVAKPITDESHLEIEKSTIDGRPYQTGGGRTVDANSIDILLTWLVNHDREFLLGGATGATKPGMKVFPYFATPNTEIQTVAGSVELAAPPDDVWSVIGQFNLQWHPAVARARLIGEGLGQLRRLETRDGGEIVERLADVDNTKRSYRYTLISGVSASHYAGVIDVKPKGNGSSPNGALNSWQQPTRHRRPGTIVSRLIETGLGS